MRKMFLKILALFFVAFTSAQTIDVSGNVNDNAGIPIPGANVIVKNTNNGAITDFDGNFSISNVEIGSTITVSYIGYITKEIVVTDNSKLTIQLEEDLAQLDEIVVIGYGTQKKKEVTGAVTVLGSKAIEKLNPVRVEQALQGQVAGVNVTSNSGSPGSGSNIRIRGISTNGDSRPLILVDGNPIEDLSVINPSDIKSINVLKDATAGIYGVRAANGVILITTKSGRKNAELKFQLDSYTGIQQTSKKIDLMGARDFAIYVNDAKNNPLNPEFFVYPTEGTDWQDEVFETALTSNVNLSASGGTEKSAYSFGVSYLDQDGIVGLGKSNYNRLTARLNYQYDVLDNLKLTATALHTVSEKNNLPEGGNGSPLYSAININPDLSVRDDNGDYSLVEKIKQREILNPLALIDNTYNTTRVSKISGTLGLDYTFWDNFKVSSKLQMNHANVRDDHLKKEVNYGPSRGQNFPEVPINGVLTNEVKDHGADYDDFTWDNFLTYTNTFNDDHNLTVLLGTSVFRTKGFFYGYTGLTEMGTNSTNQTIWDKGMSRTPRYNVKDKEEGKHIFDQRLFSLFLRLQYNYKGKYLFSGVIRRDVSSKFSAKNNNNVGYFPSASIGWNASEEPFLEDHSWINSLKFRASYGIIGNDRIDDYSYISRFDAGATYTTGDATDLDDLYFGTAIGAIGNPDIKWEEQKTANIGFDISILDHKVDISFDAFSKKTEDLLINPEASSFNGVGTPGARLPFINAGTVENKGFELKIGYSDNLSEDFKFNIGYNISTLHNEVLSVDVGGNGVAFGGEYGVGLSQTGISRMEKGLPLGYFYGYQTNGIYQTQAEIDALNSAAPNGEYHAGAAPGDLIFVDTSGNGEIGPEDRTNIGDPIPNVTMGFNIGFTYRNFDFSSSAFASLGNDMVRDYERKDLYTNQGTYMLNRWQGSGTSNSVPRIFGADFNTDVFSDFYVEDASFLRLQNVQVGYTFNSNTLTSLGLDKFRIYVSGNNLFTITDYLGYDPSASSDAPLGSGIDKGFYPVAKSYIVGLNINF